MEPERLERDPERLEVLMVTESAKAAEAIRLIITTASATESSTCNLIFTCLFSFPYSFSLATYQSLPVGVKAGAAIITSISAIRTATKRTDIIRLITLLRSFCAH